MSNIAVYTSQDIYFAGTTFTIIPVNVNGQFSPCQNVATTVLNGDQNVQLVVANQSSAVYFCKSVGDVAIQVSTTQGTDILYFTIVTPPLSITNEQFYQMFIQELPENVYNLNQTDEDGLNTAVFADNMACALMIEDFFDRMVEIFSNIYPGSVEYNQNWEYAYNRTVSLATTSQNPNKLLTLLSRIATKTSMNAWDIGLFISQYLYYRQPTPTGNAKLQTYPVAIGQGFINLSGYWVLQDSTNGVLGSTTELYDGNQPGGNIIYNINYTVFNFGNNMQGGALNEINLLLTRLTRSDLAYTLTTNTSMPSDPHQGFNQSFNSYKLDSRLTDQYFAVEFLGDESYPFNINAYINNGTNT